MTDQDYKRLAELLGWRIEGDDTSDPYLAFVVTKPDELDPKTMMTIWFGYVTGWGAAGEVIEAMRERGYWIAMSSSGDLADFNFSFIGEKETGRATAKTGPEAICKAALKALE